jgi:hypothetical protein
LPAIQTGGNFGLAVAPVGGSNVESFRRLAKGTELDGILHKLLKRLDIEKETYVHKAGCPVQGSSPAQKEFARALGGEASEGFGVIEHPPELFQRTAGNAGIEIVARSSAYAIDAIAAAIAVIGDVVNPDIEKPLRRSPGSPLYSWPERPR